MKSICICAYFLLLGNLDYIQGISDTFTRKRIDLTAEQQRLAKIVHDYVSQFTPTENGDAQLLQGCYDYYIEAFKRVMDSASKVQMDYICLQYPKYLRFAKWMVRLAQGIADGFIEIPKDH